MVKFFKKINSNFVISYEARSGLQNFDLNTRSNFKLLYGGQRRINEPCSVEIMLELSNGKWIPFGGALEVNVRCLCFIKQRKKHMIKIIHYFRTHIHKFGNLEIVLYKKNKRELIKIYFNTSLLLICDYEESFFKKRFIFSEKNSSAADDLSGLGLVRNRFDNTYHLLSRDEYESFEKDGVILFAKRLTYYLITKGIYSA